MNVTDSIAFQQASNKMFLYYEDRLSSFLTWPRQISPTKADLTSAGLYYTGQSDLVKCFMCNVELCQWNCTDTAMKEHRKWSPQCVFLKMIGQSSSEYDTCNENSFTNAIGTRQSTQGFTFNRR